MLGHDAIDFGSLQRLHAATGGVGKKASREVAGKENVAIKEESLELDGAVEGSSVA
jgi:hypothetical protein